VHLSTKLFKSYRKKGYTTSGLTGGPPYSGPSECTGCHSDQKLQYLHVLRAQCLKTKGCANYAGSIYFAVITGRGKASRSSPSPLVFDLRLLPQRAIVVFVSTVLNSTSRPGVLDLIVFFFDAVGIVVVARNIVDDASRLSVAVPLVGDHARDALGRNAMKPGLFLCGNRDDSELQDALVAEYNDEGVYIPATGKPCPQRQSVDLPSAALRPSMLPSSRGSC
jgi:hypothetical protein